MVRPICSLVALALALALFEQGEVRRRRHGNSVLERNNHPSRDGHFVQPALTHAAAATMAADTGFAPTFTGAMWASPLYMENGPGGKGAFFAVTTGNDVLALDETTGATRLEQQHRHAGRPAPTSAASTATAASARSGIISTPVIDAARAHDLRRRRDRRRRTSRDHVAHALVDRRRHRASRLAGRRVGQAAVRSRRVHNQRSALSLVDGILYVAYGGFIGDCGATTAASSAIPTANPPERGGWATAGQGEGIWAAGGHGLRRQRRVRADRQPHRRRRPRTRTARRSSRSPGMATQGSDVLPVALAGDGQQDADMGSVNPMVVQQPGSTPSNMVAQISKDGHLYLLDAANLGGRTGSRSTSRSRPAACRFTPRRQPTRRRWAFTSCSRRTAARCARPAAAAMRSCRSASPPETRRRRRGLVRRARGRDDRADRDDDRRPVRRDRLVHEQRPARRAGRRHRRVAVHQHRQLRGVHSGRRRSRSRAGSWRGADGHLCSWSPH